MKKNPDDFGALGNLLKLKRYEQPPPGYFNDFSSNVITRLEAAGAAGFDAQEAPWLRRLLAILDTNPFAAATFGLTACGLLVCGIVFSEYADHGPALGAAGSVTMATAGGGFESTDISGAQGSEAVYNTNQSPSPFDGSNLKAQAVSFIIAQ